MWSLKKKNNFFGKMERKFLVDHIYGIFIVPKQFIHSSLSASFFTLPSSRVFVCNPCVFFFFLLKFEIYGVLGFYILRVFLGKLKSFRDLSFLVLGFHIPGFGS